MGEETEKGSDTVRAWADLPTTQWGALELDGHKAHLKKAKMLHVGALTDAVFYVFSAAFFSLSAIRAGPEAVDLNLPRPSSAVLTFFLMICTTSSSSKVSAMPHLHRNVKSAFLAVNIFRWGDLIIAS